MNKHREIWYSPPIVGINVPANKHREPKIGYSPPIIGTNIPVIKHRESKIGYSPPILGTKVKTKVKNEISREQVILVTCFQELSRKNGPTEVSLMKNDDMDRAKSGSLLQRLTSRNLVVTALIANSRAKKQIYSKTKIGGPPLLPLSRYTLFKSGENQNPDLTKKWSYKKNGSF